MSTFEYSLEARGHQIPELELQAIENCLMGVLGTELHPLLEQPVLGPVSVQGQDFRITIL